MLGGRGGRTSGLGWLGVHFLNHSGMRGVPLLSPFICPSPLCHGIAWCLNLGMEHALAPLSNNLCSGHMVVNVCYIGRDCCFSKWHSDSITLMGEYAQLSSIFLTILVSHHPCSEAYWLCPQNSRTGSMVGGQISSWIWVYIQHCSNSYELWCC